MHKSRAEYRDGKAHICVEPETGLVTACALTPANASDATTGITLLSSEEPGLQVVVDGAYGSGEALASLVAAGHEPAVKPFPISRPEDRFSRDASVVDEVAGTASCPAGHTVAITRTRKAVFGARCGSCPLRVRCTARPKGRILDLHPYDALLVESRRAWREGKFAAAYRRWRPMVEALTNVMKHAGATMVRVRVHHSRTALCVEVLDNGRPDGKALVEGGGRGLIGMRQRMALYGGHLEAAPMDTGGFVVKALIPLEPATP